MALLASVEVNGVLPNGGEKSAGGKKEDNRKAEEKVMEAEKGSSSCWYECPLPKPPLPSLSHTLQRYLEYARVLAETYPGELNAERTQQCLRKFGPAAEKLQRKLAAIAESSDNWINGFWLSEMYLRQRMPLPVNFNPAYVFPRQHFESGQDQLDYAAWIVRGFLDFKAEVDRKSISRETIPDRFSGGQTTRMCMDQYERILNCYRKPAEGEDILYDRRQWKHTVAMEENGTVSPGGKAGSDEHIVVVAERQQYVLWTRPQGSALPAEAIARQLAKIRQMSRNRMGATVQPVGGASAGGRDAAGAFWAEMDKVPDNRLSLETIRSAVFVLCLDDADKDALSNGNSQLTRMEQDGLQILHGLGPDRNGLNRWFDATIQLIVSSNGCCGICIEHSVAEGIVIINMAERAIRFANANWKRRREKADDQNNVSKKTTTVVAVVPPRPLSWRLSERAIQLIREQVAEFDQLCRDVQLRVLNFSHFGKTSIKAWGVSPDGFVQLALQLAHFKLHGHLVSTYESATMRRFRFGRVDNIRAATPEALEWAKAMAKGEHKENERKKALFLLAARKQALITQENVTGQGIDNHLCALEVLSRDGDEAGRRLFQEPAWRQMMRFPLTTSQVSTSPEFVDCFLFYGPVVRDGYGCAYNIQQDKLILAISAWKSDERTKVDEFRECLREALEQMGTLLEATTAGNKQRH